MEVYLGDPESFTEAANELLEQLQAIPSMKTSLLRTMGVADQVRAHWEQNVSRELIGAQMFWSLLSEDVDPAMAMLIVHYVTRSTPR